MLIRTIIFGEKRFLVLLFFRTAMLLSRYRPPVIILAISRDIRVARQLQLSRGILSIHYKRMLFKNTNDE